MNNNFRLKSFNSAPKERYQTDLKVVLNSSRNADHQMFSHTSGSRDLHVNGEIRSVSLIFLFITEFKV